jgi:hypothetical protein
MPGDCRIFGREKLTRIKTRPIGDTLVLDLIWVRAGKYGNGFNADMASVRPDLGFNATGDVIELDLRHLCAPEPMVRILDVLSSLADGQSLLARTPCRPQPLLERLGAMGYHVDVVVAAGGDAWVYIIPDDGIAGA